jgi:hypothetical protein
MIQSATVFEKFKTVFMAVSDQMNYIYQVVGFMEFDRDISQNKKGAENQEDNDQNLMTEIEKEFAHAHTEN